MSILTATNDNVNMYMGCDTGMGGGGEQLGGHSAVWTDGADHGVSGSFIRTIMIDAAGTPGLIDLNLHDFGEHGTITDSWNHVILRVSPTTMSHVVDGTPTTDASYAVFIHHGSFANSDASTFWPSPTTALTTDFTTFALAPTAIVGAVDSNDEAHQDARHFHGDFVGLTIFTDTLSDGEAGCLFDVMTPVLEALAPVCEAEYFLVGTQCTACSTCASGTYESTACDPTGQDRECTPCTA
eukprot:SAG31_NODE_11322_length_1033_cov_1.268293_2_plen_239_part_01